MDIVQCNNFRLSPSIIFKWMIQGRLEKRRHIDKNGFCPWKQILPIKNGFCLSKSYVGSNKYHICMSLSLYVMPIHYMLCLYIILFTSRIVLPLNNIRMVSMIFISCLSLINGIHTRPTYNVTLNQRPRHVASLRKQDWQVSYSYMDISSSSVEDDSWRWLGFIKK